MGSLEDDERDEYIKEEIEELEKERKSSRNTFLALISAVVFIGLFLAWHFSDGTFMLKQRYYKTSLSSLSYDVSEPQIPSAQIINRSVAGLSCYSSDDVVCTEPVVESYYIKNADTGAAEYRKLVYMRLKNEEIVPVTLLSLSTSLNGTCYVPRVENTVLESRQKSDVIMILCISYHDEPETPKTVAVKYVPGRYAQTSTITLLPPS